MPLLRWGSKQYCYYCNSPSQNPSFSRQWVCPQCGCTNKLDKNGKPVGYDPAWYESDLNTTSFDLRGGNFDISILQQENIFCKSCQRNQLLYNKHISRYEPSNVDGQDDQYIQSLHAKYPIVCKDCYPKVNKIIHSREYFAKAHAFSKSMDRRRLNLNSYVRPNNSERFLWHCRRILWYLTYTGSLYIYLECFWTRSKLPMYLPIETSFLSKLNYSSILWSFWDPTLIKTRDYRSLGRNIKVKGKPLWILIQSLSFIIRTCYIHISGFINTNISLFCFCLTLLLFITSFVFPVYIQAHPKVIRSRSSSPEKKASRDTIKQSIIPGAKDLFDSKNNSPKETTSTTNILSKPDSVYTPSPSPSPSPTPKKQTSSKNDNETNPNLDSVLESLIGLDMKP